ncbi:GNAT family N-acetyltransferase [Pseudaeromonas sharmana]|uniref:GNAT family N-acetyltransferase n=1 Tax=Pseudaeromonas sharmana TaxID=328412 RepID=A0ABV8CIE1_9GAMM
MSEILIRQATMTDVAPVCDLMAQLGYPVAEALLARRLAQLLDHPDAAHWVALQGPRLVGVISVHFIPQLPLAGDFARISYLCIDACAQGLGIGRQLLQQVEQAASGRGCDRIELHCHTRRSGAHAFYEQCGFADEPRYFCKRLPPATRAEEPR